jgi:hypothetical protein
MRFSAWVIGLLTAVSLASISQEPGTPASTPNSNANAAPIKEYIPPRVSGSDAVAVRPAHFEPHPELDSVHWPGKGIKAPRSTGDALGNLHLTPEAREAFKKLDGQVSAVSIVSLVVVQSGMPQEICVIHAARLGLDEGAVKAAKLSRFKPATKDGVPIAMRITIGVKFSN